MNSDPIGTCWHCRRRLGAADYGREASCPGCGKSTRVCRNCRHYAPGRPNDCVEPIAERVLEKDRANFCEFFEASDNPAASEAKAAAEALRRTAEDLFK